jgi:hypothetical protein
MVGAVHARQAAVEADLGAARGARVGAIVRETLRLERVAAAAECGALLGAAFCEGSNDIEVLWHYEARVLSHSPPEKWAS